MDKETLIQLTQGCCPLLFNKNLGVASADNFLVEKDLEISFQQSGAINFFYQIVNTSKSDQIGQHWLLVCLVAVGKEFGHRKTRKAPARRLCLKTWMKYFVNIWVWDPLGIELSRHIWIHKRLSQLSKKVANVDVIFFPLQNPSSNLCGLYCLLMAHNFCQILDSTSLWSLSHETLMKKILPKISTMKMFSEIDLVRYFNSQCKEISNTLYTRIL